MADAEKVASDFNKLAGRACTLQSTCTVRHIATILACRSLTSHGGQANNVFSDEKEEPDNSVSY